MLVVLLASAAFSSFLAYHLNNTHSLVAEPVGITSELTKRIRDQRNFQFKSQIQNTFPKFNIAPKKLPSQQESSLPTIIFQEIFPVFWLGIFFSIQQFVPDFDSFVPLLEPSNWLFV